MNLQLRKFDPRSIGDNRICVIVAKRGSGKSFLTRDIMYCKKHIPFGVVFSGTEEATGAYGTIVPDSFVYSEYKGEVVENIIKRQKKLKKAGAPNSGLFIVSDDCAYDKKMMKDPNFRYIFYNGRHANLFFIMTMQYCMDMSPDLRSNIDYVFVLRENIVQNRERLYKNFFGIFPTFDMFCQVLDQTTENYECLVLDNTKTSNKIEDCVFWYKAKEVPDFKMGSPEFWQVHEAVYNSNWDEDEDENTSRSRKKNQVVVSVKKRGL
jgi:hypothetical protein